PPVYTSWNFKIWRCIAEIKRKPPAGTGCGFKNASMVVLCFTFIIRMFEHYIKDGNRHCDQYCQCDTAPEHIRAAAAKTVQDEVYHLCQHECPDKADNVSHGPASTA